MTQWAVTPAPQPSVTIEGEASRFPVRRIYCVGRNYADHAREMGGDPRADAPFFFQKPADALVESGVCIAFPMRTGAFHHEVELVAALGSGGRHLDAGTAAELVFGYAVGIDYTRRDLQSQAKTSGRPWDVAKGFDQSAGIGAIHRAGSVAVNDATRLWLEVNGVMRQSGRVGDLIWTVPEVLAELSTYFELAAGDLVYTGTPAGVGPLAIGDELVAGIDGLGTVTHRIGAAR